MSLDASQITVSGTLNKLDENGLDRVVSFFSEKLCEEEMNYIKNDRKLLELVRFLERFRCYLEGSEFRIFTDNQGLKYFLTELNDSVREARWLETLGYFGIF